MQLLAVSCLAVLGFLAAAAGRLLHPRLAIYQSSDSCLSAQLWANISSGAELRVASRAETMTAAATEHGTSSTLVVYIEWSHDCNTSAAQVISLPGLRDVSFVVSQCHTVNMLLSAALGYFYKSIAVSSETPLAILDSCQFTGGSVQHPAADIVHLSQEVTSYAQVLASLVTGRRLAGFRHFLINWPRNLTEGDFKLILAGGWNETWFLLADDASGGAFLDGDSFTRGVLGSWRTNIYRVGIEPLSTADAVLNILNDFQSAGSSDNRTTYVEFQANAAIFSGMAKVATFMPNGSVVMETVARNHSDSAPHQSQVVTVAFAQNPPFSFISDGQVRGICVDILNLVSPLLNISFVFKRIENGTWDTVIGLLANGSVDMGSCDLSVTWQRSQLVDFSLPWTMEFKGAVVLVDRTGVDLFKIFKPFDSWVYLVTTLVIFLSGAVMAALAWLSPISLWNLHALHVVWIPTIAYRDEVSVKQNIWNLFGALLHQGGVGGSLTSEVHTMRCPHSPNALFPLPGQDFYPNSLSSRTIMFFWWIVSLVLLSTYTAAMVASLTVPEKTSVPGSLEALSQLGYSFLVPAGGSTQDLFDSAPSGSIYASIRDSGRLRFSDSYPYSAMVESRDSRVAFVSDWTKLRADVKDNCSSLVVTGAKFIPSTLAFAVRRDAVWMRRFNGMLQQLMEKGLIEQLRLQYWNPSVMCKSAEPTTLDLGHTAGIFVLFLIFWASALVALATELAAQACGWSACRQLLSAGNKSHLGCLPGLARRTNWRSWSRRQTDRWAQQLTTRQLPEEFRNIRWRPSVLASDSQPAIAVTGAH